MALYSLSYPRGHNTNPFAASHHVARSKVSFIVPDQYEETVLRIFTRTPHKMAAVQRIFRNYIRNGPLSHVGNHMALVTPNPTLTVPLEYESPRKRGYSQTASGSNSHVTTPVKRALAFHQGDEDVPGSPSLI